MRALSAGLALVALTWRMPSGDWWWRAGLAALRPAQKLSLRVGLSAVAGFAGVGLLVLRADARINAAGLPAGRSPCRSG